MLNWRHQKNKGRVVLRGDIVKDDSESYAVITEQGSSASQMTAAKIMDIISRLPRCAGQAAAAVSTYTQVKMEDTPMILKIPKSECSDIWIRLTRHKWQKNMPWSCIPGMDWKKMWSKRRYCWQLQNHVWIQNFRRSNWKLPYSENLRNSSWSCDMEGHAKKCVERYCELANKTTQQLYKVSSPCIDDHHFKERELKSVGDLSKENSQIVLKCWYMARIGRPDILWSANKLARSITKWTKACDKRLNHIFFIHVNRDNIVMWVILPNNADWDCFKILTLQEILRIRNHFWRNVVYFWKSYICSNQLDVQETNCCFSQFNRIWNHLFGRRIEVGWYSRSWFMGSDCSISWKHDSEPLQNGETRCEHKWNLFSISNDSLT